MPVEVQGFGFQCAGETVELGAGGMAVAKAEKLMVSQPVSLTFSLPPDPPIKVEGVVWWKRGKLIGIRFDPSDGNRRVVETFVAARLQAGAPEVPET
jgi:PilZ domain-containing protein